AGTSIARVALPLSGSKATSLSPPAIHTSVPSKVTPPTLAAPGKGPYSRRISAFDDFMAVLLRQRSRCSGGPETNYPPDGPGVTRESRLLQTKIREAAALASAALGRGRRTAPCPGRRVRRGRAAPCAARRQAPGPVPSWTRIRHRPGEQGW